MFNLIETRNRHFRQVCRNIMEQAPAGQTFSTAELAGRAARHKAPCYYCTYEYALRSLRVLRHGRMAFREGRRLDMWREIDAKVSGRQARTGESLPVALANVLATSTASQFFISPRRAHALVCELF